MMKDEFEALIGKEIPQDEYDAIEYVYTWHPHIDATKGKQQMAALYLMPMGYRFIADMLPVARRACAYQKQLDEKRQELEKVQREYRVMQERLRSLNF